MNNQDPKKDDFEDFQDLIEVWCICSDCGHEMTGIPGEDCPIRGCCGELLET